VRCDVGILEGKELLLYSFPAPHPFTNVRVQKFWGDLRTKKLDVKRLKPKKAEKKIIEHFHTKEQIRFVELASNLGYGDLDQGDTPAFSGVLEASQYGVGSTLFAIESVLRNEVDHSFNPVGGFHHATRNSAAGFCVFNDIGIAIELLRKEHGIRRILYVDIDAHHGDGVFYSFESDPDLFIYDIHEDGRYLYPGTGSEDETGRGPARGTKINVALPPGAGDGEIEKRIPELEEFSRRARPEFIILQCGADGLAGDPIAGLNYSAEAHRMVAGALHEAAHRECSGRIVALGGGGYDPKNCSDAWINVVKSLTFR